jgi:thiol-disulfide isomerase/thioredoxin
MPDIPEEQPTSEADTPNAETHRPSPALLIFLILPLLGILVAFIMIASENQTQADDPLAAFEPANQQNLINFQAPDFEIPMLDGVTLVSPSDFEGRPVFINFWATWCGPCVRELPALEEFAAIHSADENGPVLLAINIGETAEEIEGFLAEIGVENLPVALDINQVVKADYGVQNLPTTYILDENGMVRFMKLGEMRFEEMGLYLQELATLARES